MTLEHDTVYQKLAAIRAKYPDELQRIEEDEHRITKLLQAEEFYAHPVMKDLLSVCRRDVLFSRKALATNRELDDDERVELWNVVDARLWFIERASQNFQSELAAMDQELETELARP